jgi:hypothetical protein
MSTPLRWNRNKTFWHFLSNGAIRQYCSEIVLMLRFALVGKPHLTGLGRSSRDPPGTM